MDGRSHHRDDFVVMLVGQVALALSAAVGTADPPPIQTWVSGQLRRRALAIALRDLVALAILCGLTAEDLKRALLVIGDAE